MSSCTVSVQAHAQQREQSPQFFQILSPCVNKQQLDRRFGACWERAHLGAGPCNTKLAPPIIDSNWHEQLDQNSIPIVKYPAGENAPEPDDLATSSQPSTLPFSLSTEQGSRSHPNNPQFTDDCGQSEVQAAHDQSTSHSMQRGAASQADAASVQVLQLPPEGSESTEDVYSNQQLPQAFEDAAHLQASLLHRSLSNRAEQVETSASHLLSGQESSTHRADYSGADLALEDDLEAATMEDGLGYEAAEVWGDTFYESDGDSAGSEGESHILGEYPSHHMQTDALPGSILTPSVNYNQVGGPPATGPVSESMYSHIEAASLALKDAFGCTRLAANDHAMGSQVPAILEVLDDVQTTLEMFGMSSS